MAQDPAGKRPICPRCLRARSTCYCALIRPFTSGPQVTILRHPLEARARSRVNTAWMAHLCIQNSVLLDGLDFRLDLTDAVLVFPGGSGPLPEGRPNLIFLDGTWTCARALLRRNSELLALPRLTLDLGASRYSFRRQPHPGFLSTAEAIYWALETLAPDPAHATLLEVLDYLVACQSA